MPTRITAIHVASSKTRDILVEAHTSYVLDNGFDGKSRSYDVGYIDFVVQPPYRFGVSPAFDSDQRLIGFNSEEIPSVFYAIRDKSPHTGITIDDSGTPIPKKDQY